MLRNNFSNWTSLFILIFSVLFLTYYILKVFPVECKPYPAVLPSCPQCSSNYTSSLQYPKTKKEAMDWIISEESALSNSPPFDWLSVIQLIPPTSKVYSQFHQDAILAYIFGHIGYTNKYYIEFGFTSYDFGTDDTGNGANTGLLNKKHGFRGLLLDSEFESPSINLHKHMIYSTNIVELFEKYLVPKEPDYLSIDIDSFDWFVANSILKANYRPRVITMEYNQNFNTGDAIAEMDPTLANIPSSRWSAHPKCGWGASQQAHFELAEKFGYEVVGYVQPVDQIWIRSDILLKHGSMILPLLQRISPPRPLHEPTPANSLERLVDVKVLESTQNITLAHEAALNMMLNNPYYLNSHCWRSALQQIKHDPSVLLKY